MPVAVNVGAAGDKDAVGPTRLSRERFEQMARSEDVRAIHLANIAMGDIGDRSEMHDLVRFNVGDYPRDGVRVGQVGIVNMCKPGR